MIRRRGRGRGHHDPGPAMPPQPVDDRRHYRMSLDSTWAAARIVRRITVTLLTNWRIPPRTTAHDAAVFAVTELVGNTVRHAGRRSPSFELLIAATGTHLEVAIRDGDPALLDLPEPDDTGGLAAVADLARNLGGHLGVHPDPSGGKTVHVLLPLDP
ncbi:ATP-binding protein [Kitasatospora sp. NPDC005856]|uniref:ATP-binding protein n=1 Tax=Kitasatospora sp. NPDC005856 TaxID=3154566 RepID=UPI0033CFAD03